MYDSSFQRHKTREVGIGGVVVGGDNPIWVQSMTTTNTYEMEKTVAEIHRLQEAGCELVRVTVPKQADLNVVSEIRRRIDLPLICDIHYDYKMALGCLDENVDKIRINPGNIGGSDRYKEVIRKAKNKGIPIRIGVNAGSLEKDLLEKYGYPCPPALVESALRHIETAESLSFDQIIVSLKSSDTRTVAETYRLYAEQCDYPTHIGLTEAGKSPYAIIKSAAAMAPVLLAGIGDTLRVSLLGDPVPEIEAAFDILQATTRRVRKPELIACPTCGRLEIDLEAIVAEVQERLADRTQPITISILGCIVNGVGEAKEADLGIAAGMGKGVIFKRGQVVRHVSEKEMVDALLEEIDKWDEEEIEAESSKDGQTPLPIISSSSDQ